MQMVDILKAPLLEMAYTRRKAEAIITGLEQPINQHLLKLSSVASERAEGHWCHELTTWLLTVALIRLKPSNRPGPASFYYRILFDEPYGGNEEAQVRAQLRLLSRQYVIDVNADSGQIAANLERVHRAFAGGCAKGALTVEEIERMAAAFPARFV
jgi:hypothetical protein